MFIYYGNVTGCKQMLGDTSSENDRALIPTSHAVATYASLRSLGERGIGSIVASEKTRVPAAASRYCRESVSLPDPRSDLLAYRDEMLTLARREDVRTILPARPEDCYLLSRYEDEFTPHVSLVVPSLTQLKAAQDRLELVDAAEAAGVPVPETRRLSDVDSWDADLIIKSRYNVLADAFLEEFGPSEFDVVKNVHHVADGDAPDTEAIQDAMRHDPIVQEFVHKSGQYVFGALYEDGEPLTTFQHRQIRGNSYTGGGGVYRKSIYDPELEDVARTLLDHLDWHGLACIEYMKEADTGEYVLTEINPRLWQSLPSAVRAGADFPHYYWLAATGRADEINHDYDLDVGSHQLHGELGYLLSVLNDGSPHVPRPSLTATMWQIAASIVREPYFDCLALDDPRPFIAGIRRVLST